MTVNDVFTQGLALIQAKPADDTEMTGYAVAWVNQMLAETFDIENSIRRFEGTSELTEPQEVTALTDTLTYNWRLVRAAFPKGIASRALYDEDNSLAENFLMEYYSAINDAAKVTVGLVTDVYSDESEE